MNLQKLNLVELNAKEMKDTNGGWLKTIVGILVAEWDDIVEGNRQWKREHNRK
ncbi:class IIb bacteriocin, lactobin A/cerein 7B family [Elizabethkingia ursingii]|uniref:class IIb bacteriocin, lactobin A/cerein 7B family n=1 Tax=Elizabethkingia ursingii TaxID=1756150 RepID=UPI0020133445|nr:class IIb bacteriocin, lactobin A/cerein 7B family [Elizabethkingia ursingii]MCL1671775.1 class IIb bacteriocin, lactobin A/cerein 7B family [Elizabethkingia ursingii]